MAGLQAASESAPRRWASVRLLALVVMTGTTPALAQSPVRLGSPSNSPLETRFDDYDPLAEPDLKLHTVRQVEELPLPPDDLPSPTFMRGLNRGTSQALSGGRPKPFAVDAVFMGRAGVSGTDTSVAITQVGFNFQFRRVISDRFQITLRPLADIMFLSGPGAPIVLPEQLYKVALDTQYDFQFNEQWGLSLGLTPGLWTDFVYFSSNDYRMPARLLATYRYNEQFFFAAGLLYTDNIQRNLFPAGGVIWNVNEKFRIEALFPRSRAVYLVNDFWQVYFVVEGYGGTYSIRTNLNGYLYNEEFLYRDLRVMLGTQVDYFQKASIFVEAGGVMDRKFKFDDSLQSNYWVNPAFILRVGVRF
jgi:hypothetical protein